MMFLPQIGDVLLKKHQKHKKLQKNLKDFSTKNSDGLSLLNTGYMGDVKYFKT